MLNEIADAAWDAQNKKINLPLEPFLCLKLARRIIERAYYKGEAVFYEKYGVARTIRARPKNSQGAQDWSWFAADIEASAKALGYAIRADDRQPGDVLFNYEAAAPYGHIAVLVDANTVIENVHPSYRKNSTIIAPYTCLTRVENLGYTLFARFPKR